MSQHRLAEDNIRKLLVKLSLPAMAGMFVMALYNVVDTIFVGRGVGTMAIAGLSIVFPIQMLVMSVGMLYGMGGASVISRLLGKNDFAKANLAYGNLAGAAVISGLLLTIIGMVFRDSILQLFGASEIVLPYAREYYNLIVLASPLFVIAMTGNNVLRSVGMAKSAMVTMITGAIANIILDPILIFGFDMGIQGAALATVLSQFLSVLYLIYELRSKRCSLRLKWHNLKLDHSIMRDVTAIGFSSFIRNVAGSFIFALINNKLLVYGSEVSLAAYGIVIKLVRFLLMPIIGLAQGLQPVIGYNFGANRLDKVEESGRIGLIYGSVISISGFLIAQTFARPLISIFTSDTELLIVAENAFRLMSMGIWVVGIQIVGTTIFQALGKAKESLLLSMSREILLSIPLLFILPSLIGLNGVWLTMPVADVLAVLLTILMLVKLRKKNLKSKKKLIAVLA